MIAAIIQARMGSTRLQGKVLMCVNGVPLLGIMLRRVALSRRIDRIVVATSENELDDPIVQFCHDRNVEVYRGSESDVLSRYYECATSIQADTIVRLTADCPFIDPTIIDSVIMMFEERDLDYAANTVPPETSTFPSGSDVEVFKYECLQRAHTEVTDQLYREHVTFYFWRDPVDSIKTGQFKSLHNWSKYRLSVDYGEDLEVVRQIGSALFTDSQEPSLGQIIDFLEQNPKVFRLNSSYYFGQGWKKNDDI
jgi:spore coat polysaccharide biosynthesis protein SpsF